ncbi:MAG: sigma-70 family RNA polymerase sigma factor [Bacteroidales bacterium]|jgi:RNA polymerase sigma-70 factor (ECF subfamily)|nr:sigma-70 family RNA polymerase sigma factor [Bacteroidales bacterium]
MTNISSDIDYRKVFEEIYATNLHKVQFFAYNYIHDWESAKSIANEVFTSIWNNRTKIDFNREMLPYLIVVTRNRCLNLLKKQKTERKFLKYSGDLITESELNYLSLDNPSSTILYSKEIKKIFQESLILMNDKIKNTFCLNRFGNLNYEEIAKLEGVTVKTIEYRISVALRILRKKFKDYLPIFLGYMIILLCL